MMEDALVISWSVDTLTAVEREGLITPPPTRENLRVGDSEKGYSTCEMFMNMRVEEVMGVVGVAM